MILIPYKTLSFDTTLTEEEVRNRLASHSTFSRTKNFFTTTTDHFLLTIENRGAEILIKPRYPGRTTLPCKIIASIKNQGTTTIRVRIFAKAVGYAWQLLIILLIAYIPAPVILKALFIGLHYIIGLIGFAFNVWWTKDLFDKKILANLNELSLRVT